MARYMRIQYENAWYHVMNRGAGKRYIFQETHNKETFLELMGEVYNKYKVEFHAYCIMDNHYHFLLRTPHANLPEAMKYLQGMFTRIYNKKINADGPIFRGRYKSILLEADNSIIQVCKYIHLNPVEANFIQGIDYKWSSYNHYKELENDLKPKWLETKYISNYFESTNKSLSFAAFHQDAQTDQIRNFYKNTSKENFSVLNDLVLGKYSKDI